MSEKGMDCTTPVARCVWGSMTKPRQVLEQDGPNKGRPKLDEQGKPMMEISFGLAIPKQDFTAAVWPIMAAEIATGYPQGTPARFSFKYVDGDDARPLGEGKQPYNQREGYPGCYVLACSQRVNDTFAPPPVYKLNPQSGRYDQLGPDDVKCGDYVAVGINFKVNVATGTNTPSVYVNPKAIEHVGYGTAIVSVGAVDPNAMFGGQARALPPGASAVPMQQPGAPTMPGMGQQPQYAPAPGQAPMPAPMQPAPAPMAPQQPQYAPQPMAQPQYAPQPAPAPQMMPPPAPDFVNGPGAQPAPGMAPQYAPAPGQQPQYAPQPAPMAAPMQPQYAPQPSAQPQYAPQPGMIQPPR